jgi:hypothetical protein
MVSREHSLRGQIAAEYRRRDRDLERIDELRRDLAAQQIADHVTRITASAPPLTLGQRRELAALLLGQGGASVAA